MRLFCLILTATLLSSSISSNDFIEVPSTFIEDAISKAEENLSSALEGSEVPYSVPESAEEIIGDTIYNFNLDTENIMKRLDGIDNKLYFLSLLGSESKLLFVEPTPYYRLRPSSNKYLFAPNDQYGKGFFLSSGVEYNISVVVVDTVANDYAKTIFVEDIALNSPSIDDNLYWNLSADGDFVLTYTPSSDGYFFIGCTTSDAYYRLSINISYKNPNYTGGTEPDDPDKPINPPSGDDSNILDALNTQTGYMISLSKKIDTLILITFILTFVPMIRNATHKMMFWRRDDD